MPPGAGMNKANMFFSSTIHVEPFRPVKTARSAALFKFRAFLRLLEGVL
jgi:hypothetical protein